MSFLFTVLMTYEMYLLWNSPNPSWAPDGTTTTELNLAAVIAGVLVLTVGLYITRNIYRWSMADVNTDSN